MDKTYQVGLRTELVNDPMRVCEVAHQGDLVPARGTALGADVGGSLGQQSKQLLLEMVQDVVPENLTNSAIKVLTASYKQTNPNHFPKYDVSNICSDRRGEG